jgi:hypothetical protein
MADKTEVLPSAIVESSIPSGQQDGFLTANSAATLGLEDGSLLESKPKETEEIPADNVVVNNDDGPRFHLSKIEFFLVFIGLALAVFLASLDLVCLFSI